MVFTSTHSPTSFGNAAISSISVSYFECSPKCRLEEGSRNRKSSQWAPVSSLIVQKQQQQQQQQCQSFCGAESERPWDIHSSFIRRHWQTRSHEALPRLLLCLQGRGSSAGICFQQWRNFFCVCWNVDFTILLYSMIYCGLNSFLNTTELQLSCTATAY